jgi:hypothetical protein
MGSNLAIMVPNIKAWAYIYYAESRHSIFRHYLVYYGRKKAKSPSASLMCGYLSVTGCIIEEVKLGPSWHTCQVSPQHLLINELCTFHENLTPMGTNSNIILVQLGSSQEGFQFFPVLLTHWRTFPTPQSNISCKVSTPKCNSDLFWTSIKVTVNTTQ